LEDYLVAIERKAITSLRWKKTNGIKQPLPNSGGLYFRSFRYRLKKLNLDN